MKILLQANLLVNVALACLLWYRTHEAAPVARVPRMEIAKPVPGQHLRRREAAQTGSRLPTPWSGIESDTPAGLVANLRAIGCPEKTIRDIVVLRVCRQYRLQMKAAEAAVATSWDYTQNLSAKTWREANLRSRNLRNEMTEKLEDLFDRDWGLLSQEILGWPVAGDGSDHYLSRQKRRELERIDQRYRQSKDELEINTKEFSGGLSASDKARLSELDLRKKNEIAALLTPRELEEFGYRQSAAADYVRRSLPQPKSEEEFKAMVKVVEEFNMQAGPKSFGVRYALAQDENPDAAQEELKKAAFNKRLQEVLGEDRLAQQQAEEKARLEEEQKQLEQQSRERERLRITNLATESGISVENAGRFVDRVMESEPELKEKFEALEKSLTGTPEEKEEKLKAAVRVELERIAKETIGDKSSEFINQILKH